MKQVLILSTFLLLVYCVGYGQHDKQWYMLDGLGYNGTQDSYNIQHQTKGIIIGDIELPDSEEIRAKDDLFIIYKDANYFSSRYDLWWGKRNEQGNISSPHYLNNNNNFQLALERKESAANYMHVYLTNVYDKDDLPEKVIIQDGTVVDENQNLTDYSKHWSPLTANHDVVPEKDITLIVDLFAPSTIDITHLRIAYYGIVRDDETTLALKDGQTLRMPLNWPETMEFKTGLLNLMPVFDNFSYYPNNSNKIVSFRVNHDSAYVDFVLPHAQGTQELTRPNFLYLNLKASSAVKDLFDEDTANPYYCVVFALGSYQTTNGTQALGALMAERTQPTHDPNEIIAKSICIDSGSVYFEGQFYNRTRSFAKDLGFSFLAAPSFNANSLKFTYIKANKKILSPNEFTVNIIQDSVIVKLKNNIQLKVRQTRNGLDTGKVEFGFCMQVVDTINIDAIDPYLLSLTQPKTYFDIRSSDPQVFEIRYTGFPYGISSILNDDAQFFINLNKGCDNCMIKPNNVPNCNWYNCTDFWLEDFRWLYGLLGMGLIAGIVYKLLQKDKQRIQ